MCTAAKLTNYQCTTTEGQSFAATATTTTTFFGCSDQNAPVSAEHD